MAPSHLVTVSAPQRRIDLVLPGETPMRDLIPEIVLACVEYHHRDPQARWAISPADGPPLNPDATLDQAGVLDGAVLYLRDMARAVSPVPVTPASDANVRWSQADRRSYIPPAAKTTTRMRWDLEPIGSAVATAGAADLLFAIWLLVNLSASASVIVGLLCALLVIVLYLTLIWWLGWAEWFAGVTRISWFRTLPPPRALRQQAHTQ
jgi:hypothetical protein